MRFVAVLGAIHDQTTLAASLGACAATAAALVAVLLECVSIQSLQEHRNRHMGLFTDVRYRNLICFGQQIQNALLVLQHSESASLSMTLQVNCMRHKDA